MSFTGMLFIIAGCLVIIGHGASDALPDVVGRLGGLVAALAGFIIQELHELKNK